MEVGRVVSPMAAGALEDRIVRGIGVAIRAGAVLLAMVDGEERVVGGG